MLFLTPSQQSLSIGVCGQYLLAVEVVLPEKRTIVLRPEGFLGRNYPHPHQLEDLGNAVRSPSGVWGSKSRAEIEFGEF